MTKCRFLPRHISIDKGTFPLSTEVGVKCKMVRAAKKFIILQFFFLQLPLDHLLQNLAKETEKLKEMAPHLSEDQDGQGTLRTLCKCFFKGATSPFLHLEKFT